MSGIILYSFAGSDFSEHFHIISGSLLNSLRFQQFAPILKPAHSLLQFLFYGNQRPFHVLLGGNIVGRRINCNVISKSQNFSGQRIHFLDTFYFVAE